MPTHNKTLLIIGHAPSDNSTLMFDAILAGANLPKKQNVTAIASSPFDVEAEHVQAADAVILFTTENFGYMNGALKDFFERIYYPCLENPESNEAKPYSLIIKAGLDGTGATQSVQKIVTGLKWREAAPLLLCKGPFEQQFVTRCFDHGLYMAALLDADLI